MCLQYALPDSRQNANALLTTIACWKRTEPENFLT
jgi:hypothetical protein